MSDPHRQFPVAMRFVEIELKVMRTRHGAEHELFVVDFYRRIHRVLVVRIVAALFV